MKSAAELERQANLKPALTTGLKARLPSNKFFGDFVKEYQRNLNVSIEESYAKWKTPANTKGPPKSPTNDLLGSPIGSPTRQA